MDDLLTNTIEYTFTVRYSIQSTPTSTETDEIPYGTVAPPPDLGALELYQVIVRNSSLIFPFDHNPSGKWFAKVIKSIANVSKHVAPALGPLVGTAFGAPEVGAAVGTAVSALSDVVEEEMKELIDEGEDHGRETEHVILSNEKLEREAEAVAETGQAIARRVGRNARRRPNRG
jgi:hypothetical protein